jgi:hypothetical protein
MAAPTQEELNKIKATLDEISKIYSKLGENNPFAKFDTKGIADADAAIGQINVGLRDAKKQLQEATDGAQGLYAALKATVNELKNTNSSVKDSVRSYNKLGNLAQQLRDDQKGISELNMKDLKSIQSKLESEVQNLRVATDAARLRKDELISKARAVGLSIQEREEFTKLNRTIAANNNLLNDQDSILEDMRKQVQERLELEMKIQKQLGISGAIVGSLKKLLPGPLASAMKLDEAMEKMREAAKEGKSKFGVMFAGIKSMGKGLVETLQDPMTSILLIVKLFKEFIKIGFAADKRVVDLGKGLAISKNEAKALNERFGDITRETGNSANEFERLFITQQKLAEATFQLGKAFGAMRGFTDAQLKDQIKLTKLYGMEEESAAGLQQLALANKVTADQVVDSTIKQTASLAKQTGIQLDNRKILNEVAKVSGQLRLQYKNNPELIAQAVVQTEKLGINLEKAKNMANSLLQFEDSISAELEAELLTGKQINLEQARLLALNGKTAEAATEISKQIGSSAEFSAMNVLQQEAYAKALGMSADELANMLLYNENINNLGASTKSQIEEQIALAKAKGDTERVNMLERSISDEATAKAALEEVDAQTKFNEILEKGKAILASFIEGPAVELVEMFSNITNLTDRIVGTVKAIGIAFGAIKLAGMLSQLATMASTTGVAAASALTYASGITLGIGLLAVGAAIASAMGVFSSNKEEGASVPAIKVNDAQIAPDGGLMVSGAKGTYQLNSNDTVVAGTDLGKPNSGKEGKGNKNEPNIIVRGGDTSLTIDGVTFARLITPFIVEEQRKLNMQLQ